MDVLAIKALANKPSKILFAYQPIFDARTEKLYGYEALMRPEPYSPLQFIEEMAKLDRLQHVEEITNYYGIKYFKEAKLEGKLFLNSLPATCMSLEMSKATEQMGGDYMIGRLVYEILEYTTPDRFAYGVKRTAFENNGANPLIAIDDFGTGGNIDNECVDYYKPDIVKVDRSIISHIDTELSNQETLQQIIFDMRERNVLVLAEGVETEAEYRYLKKQDIDYMQGFYLGKPKLYTEYIKEAQEKTT